MSLAPGTRIGSYEVVSIVGAGGMGEVYRARDTRLRRDVGVKVLPSPFADDAERRARFEREVPRELFPLPDDAIDWVPMKGGHSFLVGVQATKALPAPIQVVLNWSEPARTQ
jgi:hypothetical protein